MEQAVLERVRICGVEFDDLDPAGVLRVLVDSISAGRGGWIVTPNVDILRQIASDPEMAQLVSGATLVIVDGAPIQWAGRIAGRGHVNRAPGASLALPLASAARDLGVPLLLLGGRPGAGEQAAANLAEGLPGLRVDHHCPDFGFEADRAKWDAVRGAVGDNTGGIVLCGFGYPKQERLMSALHREFPDTWFLGVGGTIDFLAGFVPRAPEWVQQVGFEWMYRLAVEPKRLARRYLVDGLPFAWRLMVWAARERQQTAYGRRTLQARPAARQVVAADLAGSIARRVEVIDLDRRTVTVSSDGPGRRPAIELGFTDFLTQPPPTPDRSDEPDKSDQNAVERVIDLREKAAVIDQGEEEQVIDLRERARATD